MFRVVLLFTIALYLFSCHSIDPQNLSGDQEDLIQVARLDSILRLEDDKKMDWLLRQELNASDKEIKNGLYHFVKGEHFYKDKEIDSALFHMHLCSDLTTQKQGLDTLYHLSKLYIAKFESRGNRNYRKAKELFKSNLRELEGNKSYEQIAHENLYFLASAQRSLLEFDEALKIVDQLQLGVENLSTIDSQMWVKSRIIEANIQYEKDNWNQSDSIYQNLIEVCEKSQSLNHRLTYLLNAHTIVLMNNGLYKRAKDNIWKILSINPDQEYYKFIYHYLSLNVDDINYAYHLNVILDDSLYLAIEDYRVRDLLEVSLNKCAKYGNYELGDRCLSEVSPYYPVVDSLSIGDYNYQIELLVYRTLRDMKDHKDASIYLREYLTVDSFLTKLYMQIEDYDDRLSWFGYQNDFYDTWLNLMYHYDRDNPLFPFVMDKRKYLLTDSHVYLDRKKAKKNLERLKKWSSGHTRPIFTYFAGHSSKYLYFINQDSVGVLQLDVNDIEFNDIVMTIINSLIVQDDQICMNTYLQDFSEILELDKLLDKELSRIIYIPDQILYKIPLQLLMDAEGDMIGMNYQVSNSFSLTSLLRYITRDSEDPIDKKSVAAFSFSDKETLLRKSKYSYLELPNSYLQIKEIEESLKNQEIAFSIFSGDQCTKDHFLNKISKASVIHLSTHGYATDVSISDAYLLFRQSYGDLDYLRFEELESLGPIEAELLFVDSCESLNGVGGHAGGMHSILSYFGMYNIKNIIATHYPLNDQLAMKMSNHFYRDYRNSIDDIGNALFNASNAACTTEDYSSFLVQHYIN